MLFKNRLKNYCVLAMALVGMAACKKQLNTNLSDPNGITTNSISGKDVFASALVNTVTYTNAGVFPQFTEQWMGIWARTTSYSASGTQYQLETFTPNNAFGDNFWGVLYHNIYDYNFVIGKSATSSILPGASMVMKAYLFQDLVDIFGNVPYSQALSVANATPAYDDAKAIYASLANQLDSAMTMINASSSTADDASDIMFKGNKTSWLQFANTVKLRLLLRQIPNASTASALQPEMAKTLSYGFLPAGTDAAINPGFKDAAQQQSPFWAGYGFQVASSNPYQNNTFYVANTTFVNFLQSTNDPRIAYIYNKNSTGTYGGNLFGQAAGNPTTTLSSIGSGVLKSPAQNAVVITASESLFLQAEAAQRGLISGSYLPLFQSAVSESFRFLGVASPTTASAAYLVSSDDRINPSVATDPIKTIIYQKWVANAEIDGLEQWCDYRRTGYPDRTNPSINAAASVNTIPKRLLYPQTEVTLNLNNVNINQQGLYTKIFWGQ